MIVVMDAAATPEQIGAVVDRLRFLGHGAQVIQGGPSVVIAVTGNRSFKGCESLLVMPGVEELLRTAPEYKLVARESRRQRSSYVVAGTQVGGGCTIIAGPCSVEDESALFETARFMLARGVRLLRAGAYKPRTSPYSFQGLGERGLDMLARVREKTGIGVVTEVLDVESVPRVEAVADVLQVGTRNMHNYPLLRRLSRSRKPVLLKRGLAATVEEWLLAAEYVMSGGNEQVILCERGIRTLADHARSTLDLSVIPVIKRLSHLPIIVDPSHGTGRAEYVAPMSRAALAAGADGLLIEVHPDPLNALSDGQQSLSFAAFEELHRSLQRLAEALAVRIM